VPERLRLPQIEPDKPKTVETIASFRRTVRLTRAQEEFVLDIIACIEAGKPLPLGSYRTSRNRDILIEREGIMHLHLGHSGSRELLYLTQYPDRVVLLEISGHHHFTTRPIGHVLTRTHRLR
jgi:hypothetical protein